MKTDKYFDISLNDEQEQAVNKILKFFLNPEPQLFILKGHAGTGKTSLVKGLIQYLRSNDIPAQLLASTGRAAKILSDKTGIRATTVHKHIYDFDSEELDEKSKIRKLKFKLIHNQAPKKTVYFVDESSIISNHQVKGTFTNFGTGRLLTDLLFFVNKRKIIFVGDSAQLPPVNCDVSAALSRQYFRDFFKLSPEVAVLTKIVRFDKSTGIFFNTNKLRENIERDSFPMLSVNAHSFNDIVVHRNIRDMANEYVKTIRRIGVENCIFITLSNKQTTYLNDLTRSGLYSAQKQKQFNKNESLMVVMNNYLHNLNNGDQVLVKSVSPKIEYKAGLRFREAELFHTGEAGGSIIGAKIIENLLGLSTPNLDHEQEYKLFVDFAIRMRNEYGLKSKDREFVQYMIQDPYLNALRVKYGYAITCHKSQGGEWQEVFIQLERSLFYFHKREMYKWVYTAISRSTRKIHILDNMCVY